MVSSMKKLSLLLCVALVVCLFAGCGAKSDSDAESGSGAESGNNTTTTESTVETTKGKAKDVTISIKKDTVVDADEFIQGMKDFGADVENKEDADSFIFTFTASEYKKLLDTRHKECVKAFKGLEENQDHYVEKIEYDDNFRNLKVIVNKKMYEASTKADNYVIAACALAYQLYINEKQYTNVSIVYSGTEEVVSTFSLPLNYNIK